VDLGLDAWTVAALVAAVFVGAAVQSTVGLGVGLVAAPVTALLAPDLVPGLLLWLAAAMPVVTLARERDAVDWPGLLWALPARLPGTAVGVLLVTTFTEREIGLSVGLMVLVAVALTIHTLEIPVTRTSLVTAGFVSGVTGTATSIGGPPLALVYQHREPRQVRCTLAVYFLAGAAFSLVGLALAGTLELRELVLAVLLLPVLIVGFAFSGVLRSRVDPGHLRWGILIVCATGALALVVRSLV